MHIKIYFNDKPLFLTDDISTPDIEPYLNHTDTITTDKFSPQNINTIIHEIGQSKVHAGVFSHYDLEELRQAFWKKFVVIQAAGGLVVNENDRVLMIFRRGKWDLPKGKLDPGETLEQCAVREVEEETGLHHITLVRPLIITYHTYEENGLHILKESHWYLLNAINQQLVPQTEEQITVAAWTTREEIAEYAFNTFPSIIDVLEAGEYL